MFEIEFVLRVNGIQWKLDARAAVSTLTIILYLYFFIFFCCCISPHFFLCNNSITFEITISDVYEGMVYGVYDMYGIFYIKLNSLRGVSLLNEATQWNISVNQSVLVYAK